MMVDEAELIVNYIDSAFEVMQENMPIRDGTDIVDLNKALSVCAHWSVIGKVASFQDWCDTMNPPEPRRWPAGTVYPD